MNAGGIHPTTDPWGLMTWPRVDTARDHGAFVVQHRPGSTWPVDVGHHTRALGAWIEPLTLENAKRLRDILSAAIEAAEGSGDADEGGQAAPRDAPPGMNAAQQITLEELEPALIAAGWVFVVGRPVVVGIPGERTETWWESTWSRTSTSFGASGPDVKHILLDPDGEVRA